MASSARSPDLLKQMVSSSRSAFAFAICLAVILLTYRIQLTLGLFASSVRPFDFNPGTHPVGFMLSYLPYDLSFVVASFLTFWLISRTTCFLKKSKAFFLILEIFGLFSLHLLMLALLIIHGAHIRLLFDAQTGLDTSMIREVWMNIPFRELLKFITLKEALLLLLPIGLFWLVLLFPVSLKLWMTRICIVLIFLLSLLYLFYANSRPGEIPSEIRLNPPLFLLSDVADRAFARHEALRRETVNKNGDESGLQHAGPTDKSPLQPMKWLPQKSPRPWTVVFFIMESVGTRYAFDTSLGQPMPMPFLDQMRKGGWYLKDHYTTANISNKAIFSLLSGLYDLFNRETFCVRSEAHIPSLYNFLSSTHDSFLVTPSPITWYFPTAFLKNSGLPEIHSYDNLNLKVKEEYHSLGHYIGRDEIETVDFFIKRLNRAKEPFLGIYLSFAAHLPYFDYGPKFRVREDDGRTISRYYNNLNLLDQMIKRIHDDLKEKGLLEHTIFILVGDHGQAFGQHHPDNFMHYRYSYNENLEAPAVFYQPDLFKPRVFDFPTSHVDVLPTLLDAMRVSYDPALFDGESLFENKLKRKYLFFYGYEESFSSLDTHRIKVQYSLKKNRGWAFDLKVDPEEKNPLDCSLFPLQMEALQRFTHDHDSSLVQYSADVREKKNFQGHRHPGLSALRSIYP